MVAHLPELAQRMLADYDARTPGARTGEPKDLTTAQAYEIQSQVTRLREQRGENVVGYKVGCTSRKIQLQLGVQEPIFGRLFESESHASGEHLSCARFARLAIEGEMAVRLARDLSGETVSAEECRDAITEVFPVIELHHYVLPASWTAGQWLIASNGLHAGLVLAETDAPPTGLRSFAYSLSVRINGVLVGTTQEDGTISHPLGSLRWLTGRLSQFGLGLRKGQVILVGSSMNLYPVTAGSRVVIAAPPLGVCRVEIGP